MAFDITTLPQEAQDYFAELQSNHDRKINEVSQANRQAAVDKLKADKTFLAGIEKQVREKIEADATKTAEEKAQEILAAAETKLKEANRTANLTAAKDAMQKAGMTETEYANLLDILVDDDADATTAKVSKFLDTFTKGVQARIEQEKAKYKAAEGKPSQADKPSQKTLADYSTVEGMKELNKLKETNPTEYQRLLNT